MFFELSEREVKRSRYWVPTLLRDRSRDLDIEKIAGWSPGLDVCSGSLVLTTQEVICYLTLNLGRALPDDKKKMVDSVA